MWGRHGKERGENTGGDDDRTQSDRLLSITGVAYSNAQKMPAGIYIKNGKKYIMR